MTSLTAETSALTSTYTVSTSDSRKGVHECREVAEGSRWCVAAAIALSFVKSFQSERNVATWPRRRPHFMESMPAIR